MLHELFAQIARVLKPAPEEAPGGRAQPPDMTGLRAEVELEAQRTLDRIDDALSAWQGLEQRLERERRGLELWERKVEQAAARAAGEAGGSPARAAWEGLREEAQAEAADRRRRVEILTGIMEQARPAVEEALRLVEEIGLSREKALSQIDRLEITQATAEVKERLASARLSGEASRIEGLLREATERVDASTARAAATEELANLLDPAPNPESKTQNPK